MRKINLRESNLYNIKHISDDYIDMLITRLNNHSILKRNSIDRYVADLDGDRIYLNLNKFGISNIDDIVKVWEDKGIVDAIATILNYETGEILDIFKYDDEVNDVYFSLNDIDEFEISNEESPQKMDYMMLSRLEDDVKFYLGNGLRNTGRLYYDDEKEHIQAMKDLWNKLDIKPEWISYDDILDYEKEMNI